MMTPRWTLRAAALAAAVLAALGALPAFGQAAAPPPAEIRLAVVDMDRVLAESEMGKIEQVNIDRLKSERTGLINGKQKELESLEEQIRNTSLSWSDEKREETARTYEAKRIELRRLNEDATRDVQAEFNRAMAKLQRAALEVTSAIGRERGYTIVLEKNTLPVLYASDAIEVTVDVIQRMNGRAKAAPAGQAPSPSGGR